MHSGRLLPLSAAFGMAVMLAGCGVPGDADAPVAADETAAMAAPGPHSPRTNYALFCQGCHLPDGSGMEGRVPDMRGQLAAMLAVPEGREYLVQVPGTANSPLGHEETAALLNWLIPQMEPGGSARFEPYTAAEVERLRAAPVRDIAATRERVIGRLGGDQRAQASGPDEARPQRT